MGKKVDRRKVGATPVADMVERTLKNGKPFGIIDYNPKCTRSSQGTKQIKIRRDGNGGLIISTNEPGTRKEFIVKSIDPQDSISLLGKHWAGQGVSIAYK